MYRSHAVYKKPHYLLQVTREPVSVPQTTRESVSGTHISGITSHEHASERAIDKSLKHIIVDIVTHASAPTIKQQQYVQPGVFLEVHGNGIL